MRTTSTEQLLSTAEVCAILSVRQSTISRWAQKNPQYIQPYLKMPGDSGAFLWHPDEVERVRKLRAEKKSA